MATFHCNAKSGKAGTGKNHADYICGLSRYSEREDVVFYASGNLPDFAKDGIEFFKQADENERANGRSYRGLIIAIPREAVDKVEWSKSVVKELAGEQAFCFGVHLLKGNPHLHLMFSTRTNKKDLQSSDYFSRKNPKIRAFDKKSWLEETKEAVLKHIRKLVPSFAHGTTGGKEKQFKPWQVDAIEATKQKREAVALEAYIKKLESKLADLPPTGGTGGSQPPRVVSIGSKIRDKTQPTPQREVKNVFNRPRI